MLFKNENLPIYHLPLKNSNKYNFIVNSNYQSLLNSYIKSSDWRLSISTIHFDLYDKFILNYTNVRSSNNDLLYLTELPFNSFFNNNFIDIPDSLSVNKSIRNDVNKSELVKFSNIIMRKGRKLHCLNLINTSLRFAELSLSNIQNNWNKSLYYI